jgi:ribonuclease P protein subunit POP4
VFVSYAIKYPPLTRCIAIPKEFTVFRFKVPFAQQEENDDSMAEARKPFIFELHGSQFENRPADRANRKFKQHIDPHL